MKTAIIVLMLFTIISCCDCRSEESIMAERFWKQYAAFEIKRNKMATLDERLCSYNEQISFLLKSDHTLFNDKYTKYYSIWYSEVRDSLQRKEK